MLLLVPSSENTAFELRKYSVPPFEVSNVVPGDDAGQTVNPAPSAVRPRVLNSTTEVAVPATRAALEIA